MGIMLIATDVSAHVPTKAQHSPGGGGITQNVVAGPIKRRPVTNAAVNSSGKTSSLIELRSHFVGPGYPVMRVTAVFLGAEWRDPGFANDKIEGLDQFFGSYPASDYSTLVSEYIKQDVVGVVEKIQYDGYIVDDGPGSERDSILGVVHRIDVLARSGRLKLQGDGSSYIAVFSSHQRPDWESCGWHGWAFGIGDLASTTHVSFSYNLENDSRCSVPDSSTGHSPGLAALANESARALAEAQTDVDFDGWTDLSGNEIDDKCAWTFSVPYVTFPDGSKWKLQDLWSNKAYEAGTGYPNAQGQRGCVNGR